MNRYFNKDYLIKVLIIVSIVSIGLIGFSVLNALSGDFLGKVSQALKSVIYPFSIALILSFIVEPLARIIDKRSFLNRTLSIMTAIFLGIIAVVGILSFTIAFILVQLDNILTTLISTLDDGTVEYLLEQVETFVNSWSASINTEDLFKQIQSGNLKLADIGGFFTASFRAIFNFASSITHVLFTIVLTPVFMYFLIRDRTKIFTSIVSIFPATWQPHLKALGEDSHSVIKGYFTGHGLVMLFITVFFIISYSVMAIIIPNFTLLHALLFAIIMGLFSILPYLGVWFSMAMPVVMLTMLHLDHGEDTNIYIIGIALIFLLNIVEEIIESSLVQPNVFSKHVHIHPLAVLSSFIFFGGVFGLVGFILAVPIAGIIKATYQHFKYPKRAIEATKSNGTEKTT
ncbi:MAG: AI-2E family transporter [Bacillota bacterium]